jgi:hypothetical protein
MGEVPATDTALEVKKNILVSRIPFVKPERERPKLVVVHT